MAVEEKRNINEDFGNRLREIIEKRKKETGQNLSKYIKQYRMEKAKELLTGTNMKIVNISEQVGYPNVSYFVQSFREYFGVSPQKFRDQGELS